MNKFGTSGQAFGRHKSQPNNAEQDLQVSSTTKSTLTSLTDWLLFCNPVLETAAKFEFLPIDITLESRTFRLINIMLPN